ARRAAPAPPPAPRPARRSSPVSPRGTAAPSGEHPSTNRTDNVTAVADNSRVSTRDAAPAGPGAAPRRTPRAARGSLLARVVAEDLGGLAALGERGLGVRRGGAGEPAGGGEHHLVGEG